MYNAIVARLQFVREHPNADRLKLASVLGEQVVVGLDAKEGDLGIYFPEDGRVSTEFCEFNNLYPIKDENGKRIGGGFFDPKNNRVRAQNFRGEKSTGYFASIDSVAYTGVDPSILQEGYQFNTLNGHQVCEKYYSPKTLKEMASNSQPLRRKNIMMPKHDDSLRWQYVRDHILEGGDIVTFTEKLHGTSQRVGCVLDEVVVREPRWYSRFFKNLGKAKTEMQWVTIIGTRNVLLNENNNGTGYYGTNEFRYEAAHPWSLYLEKGEVVYGEVVGWYSETGTIMPPHDTKSIPDLQEIYGDTITYSYGVPEGKAEFYVYRIIRVNDDGDYVDLSWPQVKRRCAELGVKVVPEVYNSLQMPHDDKSWAFESMKEVVQEVVDFESEGPSTLDPRHIREGIMIRIDKADGSTVFVKNKAFSFRVFEGLVKDNDSYVDMEEIS